MLPSSSMVLSHTKHARRVWGDYQARKETQHTSKESLGWHWWANSSHQAYKQGEIGVKFLVGNLALVCCWYKKCKVLLLGLVQCFVLPPSSMVGLLSHTTTKLAKGARLWTYGEHTTNTHHPQAQRRASPSNLTWSSKSITTTCTQSLHCPSAHQLSTPSHHPLWFIQPCTIMRTLCSVF